MLHPRTPYRLLALATVFVILGCGPPADREGRSPGEGKEEPAAAVTDSGDREAPGPVAVSQAVYVADYAHIYHGSERTRYPLTTTLSVRNTDPERSIAVNSVRYYDTEGDLARRFLEKPRRLGPLGTAEFVVAEHDISGGSGANFIVEWSADRPVSPPLIEAVMISTRQGQGLSFTTRGQPIERAPE